MNYEGRGTLELSLTWNNPDLENPEIEAQLIPNLGQPENIEFDINNAVGTFTNNAIAAGYYTLVLRLLDDGSTVMGAVESVRIIDGTVTTGEFEFSEVNPGGAIQINIETVMNEPILVAITGQADEIEFGDLMSVEAAAPEESGEIIYTWYLNGFSKDIDANYILEDLPIGAYRLDVTAIAVNGKRSGSATHFFNVIPYDSAPAVVSVFPENNASDFPMTGSLSAVFNDDNEIEMLSISIEDNNKTYFPHKKI